ncbi:hypothetical protein J3R83DRAFT_5301, partial [Lanmaoa asiatica]
MTPVTSAPTFSLAYLEAVHDVQYQLGMSCPLRDHTLTVTKVAALTLLVWDCLLTLGEEIEYVWRMRRCMFKWFYFYFRYFLLVAQISHLVALPRLSSGHTTDFLCKIWYLYAISFVHISICIIDVILATRVFALFNRSRKVGVFLSGLILIELAAAGSNIALCSVMEYFEACILLLPRKEMASPLAGITVIAQSTILGMTLFKHFVAVRLGWGRTPLLSLLVRDATSCYVLMF